MYLFSLSVNSLLSLFPHFVVLNFLKYFVVLDCNITCHICLCKLLEGTLDYEANRLTV